jgi:hypothetical protein
MEIEATTLICRKGEKGKREKGDSENILYPHFPFFLSASSPFPKTQDQIPNRIGIYAVKKPADRQRLPLSGPGDFSGNPRHSCI